MDPIEELRYLVLAAQREGSRRLTDALRPLGATPAQAEVLTVLSQNPDGLSIKKLGQLLVCETGSPSRLARSVARAGWAETAEDESDRRVTRLRLTPTGTDLVKRIGQIEAEFHNHLAGLLDDPEILDTLLSVLRKVVGDGPAGAAITRRAACATEDRIPPAQPDIRQG